MSARVTQLNLRPRMKRKMVIALTSIEANTKILPVDTSSAVWVRSVLPCSDYYREILSAINTLSYYSAFYSIF